MWVTGFLWSNWEPLNEGLGLLWPDWKPLVVDQKIIWLDWKHLREDSLTGMPNLTLEQSLKYVNDILQDNKKQD